MEINNQRSLCQQLCAENKYLALRHSGNICQEISQYLKNGQVKLSQVKIMISHTCQIPEHEARLPWDVYLLFIPTPTYKN